MESDMALGMDDVDRELGLIAEEDSELLAGLVAVPAVPGVVTVDIPSAPYTMSLAIPATGRHSVANVDF
jgi:hypothetical protein